MNQALQQRHQIFTKRNDQSGHHFPADGLELLGQCAVFYRCNFFHGLLGHIKLASRSSKCKNSLTAHIRKTATEQLSGDLCLFNRIFNFLKLLNHLLHRLFTGK
ncbi:hypothetical protein D3C80_1655870 [compost metagenome]